MTSTNRLRYNEYQLINNIGYHFRTVSKSVVDREYIHKLYVLSDYLKIPPPALCVKI